MRSRRPTTTSALDLIVTPDRVIECPAGSGAASSVRWDELTDEKIAAIPLLARLSAAAGGPLAAPAGEPTHICNGRPLRCPQLPQAGPRAAVSGAGRAGRCRPSAPRPVGASTMTRTSGSVPDGRTRTRPPAPSSASTAATSAQNRAGPGQAGPVGHPHVAQHLGQLDHHRRQLRQGRPGPGQDVEQDEPRQQPVPGGGQVAEDHVAGLLAAERAAAGLHAPRGRSGRRPASSRPGCPRAAMARWKPRLAITVATTVSWRRRPAGPEVEGGDGQDVVAVDEAAPLVDRHQPVGVAVEGQPAVGPVRHHRGLERPGWVDPQPALMLVPSGRRRSRGSPPWPRAGPSTRGRRQRRRRCRSRPPPRSPSSRRPSQRRRAGGARTPAGRRVGLGRRRPPAPRPGSARPTGQQPRRAPPRRAPRSRRSACGRPGRRT